MDEPVKVKINYELSQIDELLDKAQVLVSLCNNRDPDFVEITAIGGILHSFYNGLENIFVLIGKTLQFDFKASPQWHRNLVDCMFAQPDFLTSELRPLLMEDMGFRHFYRHTYAYTIKWEKCSHLFMGLPDFWACVKSSIRRYCGGS